MPEFRCRKRKLISYSWHDAASSGFVVLIATAGTTIGDENWNKLDGDELGRTKAKREL